MSADTQISPRLPEASPAKLAKTPFTAVRFQGYDKVGKEELPTVAARNNAAALFQSLNKKPYRPDHFRAETFGKSSAQVAVAQHKPNVANPIEETLENQKHQEEINEELLASKIQHEERIDKLEAQMAVLTGEIEEQKHRLALMTLRDLLRRAKHKLAGDDQAHWGKPLSDSACDVISSNSLSQISSTTGLSHAAAAQVKYSNLTTHAAMNSVAHPPDTSADKCLEALKQVKWYKNKKADYRAIVCYVYGAQEEGI